MESFLRHSAFSLYLVLTDIGREINNNYQTTKCVCFLLRKECLDNGDLPYTLHNPTTTTSTLKLKFHRFKLASPRQSPCPSPMSKPQITKISWATTNTPPTHPTTFRGSESELEYIIKILDLSTPECQEDIPVDSKSKNTSFTSTNVMLRLRFDVQLTFS